MRYPFSSLGQLPPLPQNTLRFFLEEEASSSPAFCFPMAEVTTQHVRETASGMDMSLSDCFSGSLGFGLASVLGTSVTLIN